MQVPPTCIGVFVEHYELLDRWALHFTEHDKDLAGDLHDTFVHFTLTKPDLKTIGNLEGFLFVLMRNLHLPQLRRVTRSSIGSLSRLDRALRCGDYNFEHFSGAVPYLGSCNRRISTELYVIRVVVKLEDLYQSPLKPIDRNRRNLTQKIKNSRRTGFRIKFSIRIEILH